MLMLGGAEGESWRDGAEVPGVELGVLPDEVGRREEGGEVGSSDSSSIRISEPVPYHFVKSAHNSRIFV